MSRIPSTAAPVATQSNSTPTTNGFQHSKSRLPIWEHKGKFLKFFSENQCLIVVGETGSGKTTQIPQWCHQYCEQQNTNSRVACTQPRRIAAISVASRVADEMSTDLGQKVGYSVRFDSCVSPTTSLKYLTDGMLMREAMIDKKLEAYSIIILDEIHERTLASDILCGVVKRAQELRNDTSNTSICQNGSSTPPLKIIIMSATLYIKPFAVYFKAPILRVGGRQYPVQELVAEVPQSDHVNSALITVFQIHRTCGDGDILVFGTGQDEIESMVKMCRSVIAQAPAEFQNLIALPLYAALPQSQQLKVFKQAAAKSENPGTSHAKIRRVIFATNVAETSLTIPFIKYVVDTGLVKSRTYCPKLGIETLKIMPISKAQAKQRAGRAGRVMSGVCYRLYTQQTLDNLKEHAEPEINRCSLDGVILQMITMGISDVSNFEFLDKPEDIRLEAAINELIELGAIVAQTPSLSGANHTNSNSITTNGVHKSDNTPDDKSTNGSSNVTRLERSPHIQTYELTKLGSKLSNFPLKPCFANIILAASKLGCVDEALTIVSMMSCENLFHIPAAKRDKAQNVIQKFSTNEGDLIMLLKLYRAFKKASKFDAKQWCKENFVHIKNLRIALNIRKQLSQICRQLNIEPSSCGEITEPIRRALCAGLFNNFATIRNGRYQCCRLGSQEVFIHPSSCLFQYNPEAVIFTEIIETNKCYMHNLTLVDQDWVRSSRIRLSD